MIPVLNKFGTHCAVFGNHDFGELLYNNNRESEFCPIFFCTFNRTNVYCHSIGNIIGNQETKIH